LFGLGIVALIYLAIFPLMLHLIIFTPLSCAPHHDRSARAETALLASILTLALAVWAFLLFDESSRDTLCTSARGQFSPNGIWRSKWDWTV